MKKTIPILLAILAVIAVVCGYSNFIKPQEQNIGAGARTVTMLNASKATTTSSAIGIKNAKKITLFLSTDIPTALKATTTIGFMVSEDGTNYFNYNRLIDNVTNTIAQNLTRVETKTFTATGTALVSLDLADMGFNYLKASTTQYYGTGGALGGATVKAIIEY